MISTDTIAAIATPLTPSAIGIIRISGPATKNILQQIFKASIESIVPRQMTRGIAYDSSGEEIDDCCFVFYKNPSSYTGEDSCEIFPHGSIFILKTLIQEITMIDECRLAKNGEFTQRAFMNGKIPLSKAESIIDIIESDTAAAHKIALNQYQGHVYKTISQLRRQLMNCLERVEASLEFPDEVGNIKDTTVLDEINKINNAISPIIKASDYGLTIKHGLKFLIIGEPNVGKSSLLNALSGEERSIVTSTPGTTRDYIDVSLEYKGIQIQLIDTAGIRKTSNDIEKQGIEKINDLVLKTDGVIHLRDIQSKHDHLPFNIPKNIPILTVFNKIDTVNKIEKETTDLYISCKTMTGLTNLKESLISTFISTHDYDPNQMLCNLRQISALKNAEKYLSNIINGFKNDLDLDIIAIDLHDCIKNLANITGEDYTEELLDGIFANFCIGK